MKKFVILPLLFIHAFLYSQARINEEYAAEDTGREIDDFIGWRRDIAGQWRSELEMITLPHGFVNLNKLKLYSVLFQKDEYYLLAIKTVNRPVSQDSEEYQIHNYYIINKNDFIVNISGNKNNDNHIKIVTHNVTTVPSSYETNIEDIKSLFTVFMEDRERINTYSNIELTSSFLARKDEDVFFELYTFYYTEDNVVRFYFGDYKTTAMPQEYYFECPFEQFNAFFNPVIRE